MHRPLVSKLVVVVLAMFGFGFLLVPLYDVFCEITGLNGKPSNQVATAADAIDTSRWVTVEFLTHDQAKLPWQLVAKQQQVKVHPGQPTRVEFTLSSAMNTNKVAQMVPSVAPSIAAQYLHKMECFCFNQQPIAAQQSVDMPVVFYVSADLPKDIHTLTLSYTLFDVSAVSQQAVALAPTPNSAKTRSGT